MKTQPPEVKSNPRIVWGTVNGDGSIANQGSGDWTVVRTGPGGYTVMFSPPFKTKPAVTMIGMTWNVIFLAGLTSQMTPGLVTFSGWVGATQTDTAFSFAAIGPGK